MSTSTAICCISMEDSDKLTADKEQAKQENGKAVLADRVTKNKYKLIPNHEYVKDPTIHLDPASEDCYLFVALHNGIALIEEDIENTSGSVKTTIYRQMMENKWYPLYDQGAHVSFKNEKDGLEYTVFFKGMDNTTLKVVDCDQETDQVIFGKFIIDADASEDKLNEYASAQVNVMAYAVQADGLDGMSILDIWNIASGNATTAGGND